MELVGTRMLKFPVLPDGTVASSCRPKNVEPPSAEDAKMTLAPTCAAQLASNTAGFELPSWRREMVTGCPLAVKVTVAFVTATKLAEEVDANEVLVDARVKIGAL